MRPLFCFLYTAVATVLICCPAARAQDSLLKSPVINWLKKTAINNSVQLQWTVSNTDLSDSVDFIVERSRNGINFQAITRLMFPAQLAGPGFLFTDNNGISDSSFYRVTWNRPNNQPVVSDIQKILVVSKPKIDISIMPNPVFNNACLIMNYEELGDITCTLFDLAGKTIRSFQFKKNAPYMQHILEMYNLPKGDYILNVRGASVNETRRVLKQ